MRVLVVLVSLLAASASASASAVACGAGDGNCTLCSSPAFAAAGCGWCGGGEGGKGGNCTHLAECKDSLCVGTACDSVCVAPCTDEVWPCSHNWLGELILIAFYGVVLAAGAKIISDGSELLLDLFPTWATVIGGLFLPVLGAIPDAAIIVVSGALGSKSEAQEQVGVGMGTLAGSTIMLLTVTWAASMVVARCDRDADGTARSGVCNGFSLTKQGITVDQDTPTNAKIMIVTSLAYLIVQGIAFAYLADPEKGRKVEEPFALAGMIVCFVLLCLYCGYQLYVPKLAAKRAEKHEKKMEEKRQLLRAMSVVQKWFAVSKAKVAAPERTAEHEQAKARDVGMMWRAKAVQRRDSEEQAARESSPLLAPAAPVAISVQGGEEPEEEDEAAEIQANFGKYLLKSIVMMIGGTAVCALFSDPMVGAISDFAVTANIKAFYISFIVTPYCSNASELISSLQFASKKKIENSSLTYSQVYGAASMNNTLCLGIFFALIYFRGLTWEFSAETLAILTITWIMGALAFSRQNFQLFWAIPVIILYPLSIVLVFVLENYAGWT